MSISWSELIARLTPQHGDRIRLARELEVDRKSVYDWANGSSQPRGRNARILRERARAIGYEVNDAQGVR
jgi:hypothetical protein